MLPKLDSLMEVGQNEYISIGELEELEKTAIEEKYSFIKHWDNASKE
jgi:hypothetical protein